MDGSEAINIQGLTKEFSQDKKIIQGIDLSVYKGELFCLVGANGAGKTTLIKILCNLILPTSGEIFINGYDVSSDSQKTRSFVGLVAGDERSFYWRLTGKENMEFFSRLYNLSRDRMNKKIKELFDILRIEEPDKKFQEYSSGVKQKLSIARALLNDPGILFIDELTKNLDPISARELKVFIKETLVKKNHKTVFFSTHHLYEVEELADRVAFMVKGKITAVGTFKELRNRIGIEDAKTEEIYRYFIKG